MGLSLLSITAAGCFELVTALVAGLDWIFGGFWLRTRGYQDSFIGFISQTSFADDEARMDHLSARRPAVDERRGGIEDVERRTEREAR